MTNDPPKGCLQPIKKIRFKKGRSNRVGFVAFVTLQCNHVMKRFAGKRRGKRMHCETCIKLNG